MNSDTAHRSPHDRPDGTRLLTLLVTLAIGATSSTAVAADLFQLLDADHNGTVTAEEVSDSQRPWFRRALRVADHNEDGQLSAAELETALTDRAPVAVENPAGRLRLPPGFDIGSLDRNRDGQISIDEVPEPLRDRVRQRLAQTGGTSIPVETARGLLEGVMRSADRDDSGEGTPAMTKDDKMTDRRADSPAGSPAADKPASDNPAADRTGNQMFQQLDRNNNRKLERSELPRRLQAVFSRADSNHDGSLDLNEFQAAARRLMQNP